MTSEPEVLYDLSGKRVYVAGHRGMVGTALMRRLAAEDCEILTIAREEVDLRRQDEVETWMAQAKPHAVFLAAAKVGGHPRQRHLAGRVSLRQPADRSQFDRGIQANRR